MVAPRKEVRRRLSSLCLPPGIKRSDGSISFMLGGAVALFDALRYFFGNLFPFEIVVYHLVAEGEFIFIESTRILIEKIGGRRFVINPFIRTEKAQ
jgi:hypothetical protein